MYKSLNDICIDVNKTGKNFYELLVESDSKEMNISTTEAFEKMKEMFLAMEKADEAYEPELVSASGLSGTDGQKVHEANSRGELVCGSFIGKVMERAIKMGESNACMKRIVAAPTAGSCGVVPAVLISLKEEYGYSDDLLAEALYVAAGIGGVIAERAFIAGAAGGCQAEIGASSSMAAGAVCYLRGGSAEQIANAAALALKNLLGLACDPVAGLVEVPCIKRNVMGAVNALTSADLSMAGVVSRIPPDEVIDAMRSIGRSMDESIRETGKGGLAATPTGVEIKEKISF